MPGKVRQRPLWIQVPVPQPAAGQEFTLPGARRGIVVVHALVFRFVASAVAATRVPQVALSDGSVTFFKTAAEVAQTAGQTFNYTAYDGSRPSTAAVTVVFLGWPVGGLVVPPGYTLSSLTTAIDGGDQYSSIAAYVEEIQADAGERYVPGAPSYLESETD